MLIAGAAFWLRGEFGERFTSVSAQTVRVKDGDTLILGGKAYRLDGLDAPEYRQGCADAKGAEWPCGKAARSRLAALTATGAVTCQPLGEDRYERVVATCGTTRQADFARIMVAEGLAVATDNYAAEQTLAKAAKRGIWQGNFTDPAVWRQQHPREERP